VAPLGTRLDAAGLAAAAAFAQRGVASPEGAAGGGVSAPVPGLDAAPPAPGGVVEPQHVVAGAAGLAHGRAVTVDAITVLSGASTDSAEAADDGPAKGRTNGHAPGVNGRSPARRRGLRAADA
jgi:hypothetical protein